MNNFTQRTLTGTIYVVVVIGSMLVHPLLFASVMLVVSGFANKEVYKLFNTDFSKTNEIIGIIISSAVYICCTSVFFHILSPFAIVFLVLILFSLFVYQLFCKNEHPVEEASKIIFGIIYITIPLAMLSLLFEYSMNSGFFNYQILMGYFIILWANDTFAYLTGKLIGKHKLFERVSPKKTWEGSIGGFVFSMLCAYILSIFFVSIQLNQWLGIASIIVVMGSLGDLFESLLKRKAGVKDSGNVLPGHGGMLDRFDSVFFSAPFVCFFLIIYSLMN